MAAKKKLAKKTPRDEDRHEEGGAPDRDRACQEAEGREARRLEAQGARIRPRARDRESRLDGDRRAARPLRGHIRQADQERQPAPPALDPGEGARRRGPGPAADGRGRREAASRQARGGGPARDPARPAPPPCRHRLRAAVQGSEHQGEGAGRWLPARRAGPQELSALAKSFTGCATNGFVWFGLGKTSDTAQPKGAEQ